MTAQMPATDRRHRKRDGRRRLPPASAQKAMELFAVFPRRTVRKGNAAADYPISQALLHELTSVKPEAGEKDPTAWTRYNCLASRLLPLLHFFGGKAIGEVDAAAAEAYCEWREETKELSASSIAYDFNLLRKAIRRFIVDNGLVGGIDIPTPRRERLPAVRSTVARSDLARLLWAARGRRWDEAKGAWQPSPGWDGCDLQSITRDPSWQTVLRRKRSRRHVARLIMICAYTASSAGCVRKLRWSGHPDSDCSYVDLDVAPPLLYRLGLDANRNPKLSGRPVLLNRRITSHLRRWRSMDQRIGIENVIHFLNETCELTNIPNQTFESIVRDAGLEGRKFYLDHLRVSAARHIAKRDKMILRSGALLMGISTARFEKLYGHLSRDYQKAVVTAFDRKPGRGDEIAV